MVVLQAWTLRVWLKVSGWLGAEQLKYCKADRLAVAMGNMQLSHQ